MRFSAADIERLLAAIAVLTEDDPHRHSMGFAQDAITDLGPRLVDAYCAAVGLELPIRTPASH